MLVLYEYYKLIQKKPEEIKGFWRGVHIMLAFLTFVFGIFCTFCFQMLITMFDGNCVLFPKSIYFYDEYDMEDYDDPFDHVHSAKTPHLDMVNTKWADIGVCVFPVYMPLVSGIFGLIWTGLLMMCNTESRTTSDQGAVRPWRMMSILFFFSSCMVCACLYSTMITVNGIKSLCSQLFNITNTEDCDYTMNVLSLKFNSYVRALYQATKGTLASAWLHTACWCFSVVIIALRVVLVVDFHLVRIDVTLNLTTDEMLQLYEKHLRTFSPSTSSASDELDYKHIRFDVPVSTFRHHKDKTKVKFRNLSFDDEVSMNSESTDSNSPPPLQSHTDLGTSVHPSHASESSSLRLRFSHRK